MQKFNNLIDKIKLYNPNTNVNLIQKGYILSKEYHGSQKRHSGDLYFIHPLEVANIIADLKLDDQSIISALLHDVVEDTECTLNEINDIFGEEIANLVDGVTKLGKIEVANFNENEKLAENLRKLTLAISKDIRVLLIKLADRLHNMRTLHYIPNKEKRIKKATESLEIFAPLAGRIGLNKIKDELQELAFTMIDPESRLKIISRLEEIKEENKDLIEQILDQLIKIFKIENLNCHIEGREKKPYSIWQKMKRQNIGFYNLHDIMGFRIIVDNISECYRALGIVNSNFNMIPGTFKDYISTPKENGYQSIHLAILGPLNKKIEIQIRDIAMHEVAELGIAAHWGYKEKNYKYLNNNSNINFKNDHENYRWIRELISLFENSENASDVLANHKLSMHNDEVFCFTPNGDIFNLPNGATIIDFAYAIHSEIGNSCISAKVNGAIAPLRQKLENGDQVEILTTKNAKPSSNWIQFAITYKAKYAIKNFIKNEKFTEYSKLGRVILQKYFLSKNIELTDLIIEKIINKFSKKNIDELCFKIADGSITRQEVFRAIYPDFEHEEKNPKPKKAQSLSSKNNYSLPIEGLVDGMSIRYAGCCTPIAGDPIVGVINTGTGVTIHNQMCFNLKNIALNPQRILDVCWKDEKNINNSNYATQIRVVVENKSGALAEITNIIAKKKINITNIKTTNSNSDVFEVVINLEVKSVQHLDEILSALRISKKTIEVQRLIGFKS